MKQIAIVNRAGTQIRLTNSIEYFHELVSRELSQPIWTALSRIDAPTSPVFDFLNDQLFSVIRYPHRE